ncbi:MAG TPA: hypothetical protein VGK17_00650 [Propionicimonas sp.]|jgi:hypothetical protein
MRPSWTPSQRALGIEEKVVGQGHRNLAWTLMDLALMLRQTPAQVSAGPDVH